MTLQRGGADEIWQQCRLRIVYLQSVMQTAARLVSRHWKWTSVFKEMRNKLHWLHYLGRVEFKCCTIYNTTYFSAWCLHNNELQYSSELYIPVATLPECFHFQSSASGDLFRCSCYVTLRPSALMDFYACLEQSTSSSNGPIVIILKVWTFAENEPFCSNTYFTIGMPLICAVCFERRIYNISI